MNRTKRYPLSRVMDRIFLRIDAETGYSYVAEATQLGSDGEYIRIYADQLVMLKVPVTSKFYLFGHSRGHEATIMTMNPI